jgi:hypothetical protein
LNACGDHYCHGSECVQRTSSMRAVIIIVTAANVCDARLK